MSEQSLPRQGRLGLAVSHFFERPGRIQRELVEGAEVLEFKHLPPPPWLADFKPAVFHWGLGPVLSDFKTAFVREGLADYLASGRAQLFSFDLGPSALRHQGLLPVSASLSAEAIFKRTDQALKFVRRFYRGALAAENYNFYPTGLYRHITEPAFIERYLNEFGLELVLDLAHGAITAYHKGETPESYFAALPLSKVTEIHISRPYLPKWRRGALCEGVAPDWACVRWAADWHKCPGELEWSWLSFVLSQQNIKPDPLILIEYYEKITKLKSAQERLAIFLSNEYNRL